MCCPDWSNADPLLCLRKYTAGWWQLSVSVLLAKHLRSSTMPNAVTDMLIPPCAVGVLSQVQLERLMMDLLLTLTP
jgi:hypothetical protein